MSEELNFHHERSRLSQEQLARWQGLPLCWVDARSSSHGRNLYTPHPVLALIDAGAAEADISFPLRTVHLDVAEGTMGLFEPGETRSSRWRCDSVRRIMIDIDMTWLAQRQLVADEWRTLRIRQDLAFRDPAVIALARAMVREAAEHNASGRLYAEALSVALAARLAATHGSGLRTLRERGQLTTAQLRRVDEQIDARLDGSIPLALLAEAAGFSAPHFARLFRRTVGCSPHQYVLRKRVERARMLLERTRLPLAAVASAAGFSTQSHMSTVFARLLGTTPGQLRPAAARPAR